jgi:hypothetical protein
MQHLLRQRIGIIDQDFLLFLAQLPAAPSSARVALWRRLRGAGAASLVNGAWVLPRTDQHAAFLARLAETVRGQGGNAMMLVIQEMRPTEAESIVARFQTDRGREYDEFEDRSRAFLAEIKRETRRYKFTFAELEEIEDDLEKLSAWLEKIRTRDFFPSGDSQVAMEMLERCRAAFRTFAEAVYSREGVALPDDPQGEKKKPGR